MYDFILQCHALRLAVLALSTKSEARDDLYCPSTESSRRIWYTKSEIHGKIDGASTTTLLGMLTCIPSLVWIGLLRATLQLRTDSPAVPPILKSFDRVHHKRYRWVWISGFWEALTISLDASGAAQRRNLAIRCTKTEYAPACLCIPIRDAQHL